MDQNPKPMEKASPKNNYHYNKNLQPFANSLRKNMTKAEACLWKYVLGSRQMKGYQFRRQRPVLNYIADFMCKELLLAVADSLQFILQPAVQPFVPVEMGGELVATSSETDALGVFPLLVAGRAAGGGGKGVPNMPAGAGPVCAAIGLPAAFWAFYFDIFWHWCIGVSIWTELVN